MDETNLIYDQYCFYTHRLKTRSTFNYKSKLVTLAKDSSNPHIVKLAKELFDASENYNTYYYSDKAKDLTNLKVEEVVEATENYLSLLGGFIGNGIFKTTLNLFNDQEIKVPKDEIREEPIEEVKEKEEEQEEKVENEQQQEHGKEEQQQHVEENHNLEKEKEKEKEKPKNNSNNSIRKNLQYQWSTVFGVDRVCKTNDALIEMASVVFNLAIWYMGYAQYSISMAKDGLEEENRQKIYDYLLKAAGIFNWLREGELGVAIRSAEGGSALDLSDSMLGVLHRQAIAQAQEITIGRAFKKGTSAQVVTKLAVDTSNTYSEISTMIAGMENLVESRLERFMVFCQYKQQLYLALSYNQLAFYQNATHGYGLSIANGNKSKEIITKVANNLRALVSNTVSLESLKRPVQALTTIINRDQSRFERENKVIGYQDVPEQPSDLPEGNRLAKSRPFTLPPINPIWSETTLQLFNSSKKLSDTDITPLSVSTPSSSSTNNSTNNSPSTPLSPKSNSSSASSSKKPNNDSKCKVN